MGCIRSFSKPYSMMESSFSRIVTGSDTWPQTQALSHNAGQTRPVNSGKGLVFSSLCSAPS